MTRWLVCLLAALTLALVTCSPGPTTVGSDMARIVPAPYLDLTTLAEYEVVRSSQYLTMRDGVRIAIDVYLPPDLPPQERLPTMLHQTRYWRSLDYRWPFSALKDSAPRGSLGKLARHFLVNGYAWVDVDARGSGASFGNRPQSHGPDEVRDGAEIVDWIIRQPWSNGKVGAIGMSYDGSSAEFLLVNRHPAVKAVAPMFSLFDSYAEIAFPGGIHHRWFTETWSRMNDKLDRNVVPFGGVLGAMVISGVRPVDGDEDGDTLAQALSDHASNWNPHREALGVAYRDDVPPSATIRDIDALSPHQFVDEIAASGAAVYSYTGWFDGAYAHAAIRRHLTLSNPDNKLMIGPWDHGGRRNISPFSAGPAQFDHAAELLKFFDHHLKGISTGLADDKPIHYFTMGEERWKAADSWPPASTTRTLYLAHDNALRGTPPTLSAGADTYRADYTAGTGEQSRWHTLIQRPLITPYPDRAEQDAKLLTYTSTPLETDTEVTGHPLVTLYVSSTARDGAFFVYLEDVDQEGRVHYVTEGLLRALHRRLSEAAPPYRDVVPYRSYKREDGLPLQPNAVTELVFDLLPTSYLFKKTHRIRIALACADRDHFALIPPDPPTVTVYRNDRHPSRLDLPVVAPRIIAEDAIETGRSDPR